MLLINKFTHPDPNPNPNPNTDPNIINIFQYFVYCTHRKVITLYHVPRAVLRMITKTYSTIRFQLGDPNVVQKPDFPVSFVDHGYGLGYIVGFYRGKYY